MGDYNSIDLIGWDVLQQSRQGRIPHVEYESKVILLNQKAAARLTSGGPSSARPQNSHPHRLTLGEDPASVVGPAGLEPATKGL
jgi:hypothetical protein